MAIVPGSGAVIRPIFDDVKLGVDSVIIDNGGSGYSAIQPPNIVITNCGNPLRDAKLQPVIINGRIVAIKVIDPGEGYDPLRVILSPQYPSNTSPDLIPTPIKSKAILKPDGSGEIQYVQVTNSGDNQFYDVTATVVGGGGSNASIRATPRAVTSLVLTQPGRNYETPPFLSINGGGGQGASGVCDIDTRGVVDLDVNITNPGQFYLQTPYVLLLGGGGAGAKAKAVIQDGLITDIVITDQGRGYTSAPKVTFGRSIKIKRVSRNRQSYNLKVYNITGLTKSTGRSDSSIYVSSTETFPGSGLVLLEKELIRYTSKDSQRLSGCTRGINFRYDQRVILDALQDNPVTGESDYEFNVGDRLVRIPELSTNKIAVVYDWVPQTKELFVVFVVDELAFIDAGSPGDKTNIRFEGGVADASDASESPHTVIEDPLGLIYKLTDPPSVVSGFKFQDILPIAAGDGLPDLDNSGTTFEDQINLDGGTAGQLYGIEETTGGTNTTLFQTGDQIKDSSQPFKVAGIAVAGGLSEGVEHDAKIEVVFDTSNSSYYNSVDFVVDETVTGQASGIQATVESWNSGSKTLVLKNIVPYDTLNILTGVIYEFSTTSTVVGVNINSVGLGYTSDPTVNIDLGTAIYQATATASISADQVTSVTVTGSGGYGYTTKPEITFTGGGGSGVVAEAILGAEKIQGANGALWRIQSLRYLTELRNEDT
jgi:hypothetical protein